MARTLLTETFLDRDTPLNTAAAGVYQAGDNTNNMYLAGTGAGAGGLNPRKGGTLILHCKNTNAASRTVTVKAGSGGDVGPSPRAVLGDLVVTVAATTGEQMVKLYDTMRFIQSDGSINLDISGANVTIAAFRENGF